MKLLIDTTEKIVKIEENSVNLRELFEQLNKLLPDNEWMDYKLSPKLEIKLLSGDSTSKSSSLLDLTTKRNKDKLVL